MVGAAASKKALPPWRPASNSAPRVAASRPHGGAVDMSSTLVLHCRRTSTAAPRPFTPTAHARGAAESLRPALDRLVPCVAALPAAVLACLMSHPGDMVLTAYYNGGGGSVVAAVRKLVAEGGMPALFRGLRARLLHVISIIWVQLVVYDKVKQVLGLPATGH